MKWITRERPKIDRIACPWLIKRFVDENGEFIYVPFENVLDKAKKLGATPFDIPNVEYTHYGDECTFDFIVKKHKIKDGAIKTMSVIVRGADTDRHEIASQASGLWAISAGLAYNTKDDQELLQKGILFTALTPPELGTGIKTEDWSAIQNGNADYEKRRDAIVNKINRTFRFVRKVRSPPTTDHSLHMNSRF